MTAPVLLIDTDVSGHRSVIDLCRDGRVLAYPCRSFSDAEGIYWMLARKEIPTPSRIVIDTITNLANKTRQDVVLDPARSSSTMIWGALDQLTANQKQWGKVGDAVTRLLRNFFELDIPTVFIAHEGDREDPMTGITKAAPDVQKMILQNIIANADAIVRLRSSSVPYALADGTVVPAGSRQLLLKQTADSAVGVRSIVPVPEFLLEPTWDDFVAALHEEPHNTLLYGPPKIGKTTFAAGADRRVKA